MFSVDLNKMLMRNEGHPVYLISSDGISFEVFVNEL